MTLGGNHFNHELEGHEDKLNILNTTLNIAYMCTINIINMPNIKKNNLKVLIKNL